MAGLRILIVGGAVIGSAVAAFLTADPAFADSVLVVEQDPTYAGSATALSAGSIRQQFSTPVCIAMSRFGHGFIGDLAADGSGLPGIDFTEGAYLFLATARGAAALGRNVAVQRAAGAAIATFDGPAAIAGRFGWLNAEGLALAALGEGGEGWFDGYSLLQALRARARQRGAVYRTGTVTAIARQGGRITGATLADGTDLPCDILVNAAGPWAGRVAALAGAALPVGARKRCVFHFRTARDIGPTPLVIDPSGVWFRPEGHQEFICGIPSDPDPDVDPQDREVPPTLFEDRVWPALAERVPAFEEIRLKNWWAGHYDYCAFDQNAVIGPHPEIGNLLFCNGFSGHGLQHAPAAGRGIAELVVHGGYRTLDLSPLGYDRLLSNRPIVEEAVI